MPEEDTAKPTKGNSHVEYATALAPSVQQDGAERPHASVVDFVVTKFTPKAGPFRDVLYDTAWNPAVPSTRLR